MSIMRWNPLNLAPRGWWEPRIWRWPDIAELFDFPSLRGWPSMDIYSEGKDLVVKMELPGMKAEDISIDLNEDRLSISGKQVHEEEVREEEYYRKERFAGSFSRVVPLPKEVGEDDIKADMKDGLLTVRVKGAGKAVPGRKRIPVEAK